MINIMTDWMRDYTFLGSYPTTSFLVCGVSFYTNTVNQINIDDILQMEFEPDNTFDAYAIVIKRNNEKCGYVPKHIQHRIAKYVPCQVRVIDKCYIEHDIHSLRVDIELKDD